MKEIRDIKIDLVMGNKNPIVDLFREITDGLNIIKCDVYNNDGSEFIYYNREVKWIFYQDVKNEEFWCDYNRYWEIFKSEFNLKYEEIQALTKFLVEEALKREVDTTPLRSIFSKILVEEALKREVTTPCKTDMRPTPPVEEALKREVTTPFTYKTGAAFLVEEALKREVATPVKHKVTLMDGVGDTLKRKLL